MPISKHEREICDLVDEGIDLASEAVSADGLDATKLEAASRKLSLAAKKLRKGPK